MLLTDSDDDPQAMQEVVQIQHQLGELRKARRWTLAYVAEQLNVHPSTVWRWENNPAHSRALDDLQMYARFLGYTLRVLLVEPGPQDGAEEPATVAADATACAVPAPAEGV